MIGGPVNPMVNLPTPQFRENHLLNLDVILNLNLNLNLILTLNLNHLSLLHLNHTPPHQQEAVSQTDWAFDQPAGSC